MQKELYIMYSTSKIDKMTLNLDAPLNTPVLYIVFKRLDMVMQSFESIRKAKPPKLYIASDGPRKNNEEEIIKVNSVRKYITDNIDWECEVKTRFREINAGCNINVTSAIRWFFENEESGIVIEDDILPNRSFFYFCEELLNYYRDDERIMFVGGMGNKDDAGNEKDLEIAGNYHFIKSFHVWGWASWRRAWNKFDLNCKYLDYFLKENIIFKTVHNAESLKRFLTMFKILYDSRLNRDFNSISWDFSVCYMMFINNGLSILPNFNLVSNIGHGHQEGTYSQNEQYFIEERREISEIIHPKFIFAEDDYNIELNSLTTELENSRSTIRQLQDALDKLLEAYALIGGKI